MHEIRMCGKTDSDYPKIMKHMEAAPDALYYIGDISVCESVVVGVIGRREAQERYLQIARRLGELLAKKGCTVLNGLALGCDTQASEGAVSEGGKVIAVMPGGLDEIYPKKNQRLAERILKNGGCIISEYPVGTHMDKHMFIRRDRIQAMLAQKVFVVDAEKKGGTMHTAEYAVRYARPLGCFLEKSHRESSLGNQYLVESHKARAISDTAELIEFVNQPEFEQLSLFG